MNIKYDINNITLLLQKKSHINYLYEKDIIGYTRNSLIDLSNLYIAPLNNFSSQLNILLNQSPIAKTDSIDSFTFSHIQLATILCYSAFTHARNSYHWKYIFDNNEQYLIQSFFNFILQILKMAPLNQNDDVGNVLIKYHLKSININLENKSMKPNLINIESMPSYNFKNRETDLEICYVYNNTMFSRKAFDSQQNIKCATYVEINTLPYCLYISEIDDHQSISAFNLYKCSHVYVAEGTIHVEREKYYALGQHFASKQFCEYSTNNKRCHLNKINAYHSACCYLNDSKKTLRLVGDYMGYVHNYKIAALDFLILTFVVSITGCQFKYNLFDAQEKMFKQLKNKVCKLSAKRVFEMLLNYNINVEPLDNFTQNYTLID
ncbi:hypothetical protein [Lonomia obliqua multiple nucleopolyhedrovirus]|uniref:Uncharacterized protein n=1 Tax=Lonomia obliqua multiple nucleopolyhedrovirus TaxID=134394 RepID=A0A126FCC2_9ABAC|nr:hypothetical protein [Lonomia obliqua multiple nucleopolyhedrovirus]AKN81037.1 hypothetical protein [Lonomia obliqua multiple nucleopolyhedrovirus]